LSAPFVASTKLLYVESGVCTAGMGDHLHADRQLWYFSIVAKRMAGKSVPKMIYFLLSGMLSINSINQSTTSVYMSSAQKLQLSLASLWVTKQPALVGWGKNRNVTCTRYKETV